MPLAEHDICDLCLIIKLRGFNSRAPRGARQDLGGITRKCTWFQFTCPSRSTTSIRIHSIRILLFQFTCPSRSTTRSSSTRSTYRGFQFTCPSRSTTTSSQHSYHSSLVSIHVPLAEHDGQTVLQQCRRKCFNSRAPRGARRRDFAPWAALCPVSIHVPLAEHDR